MYAQFDDMRMAQGPHILKLPPYSRLCLFTLDDCLGDVLHSDFVARHCVDCHWARTTGESSTYPDDERRERTHF
jgi:hypothetical protein